MIVLGEEYESIDIDSLTQHMVVLGQTGSGKTGFLLSLTESLMNNEIPTILVDIKGDMANIMLTKHHPYHAFYVSTPGSSLVDPVNVLGDMARDPNVGASSILKMIGEDPDPMRSSAHAFLATAIYEIRLQCTLRNLVHEVMRPSFDRVGALSLSDAFPPAKRKALAVKLNTLLVSPEYKDWIQGEPLDFDCLEDQDQTNCWIYSVSHLVEEHQRQFAISLLLEELMAWARSQGGSNKLKAVLVIDEVFGLLPPHPFNPPTKKPLMLLLKQARAFGIGVVLATQNPVDVDYKALSNCGTWVVGKLSTDKDRKHVVSGIGQGMNMGGLEETLCALHKREFALLNSQGVTKFGSRDTNCELVGPITINKLAEMVPE